MMRAVTEHVNSLIIGAGVTGLTYANFTTDDSWLVLDRDAAPGGYCKTVRQDGFVWDYSGHFFHFREPWVEAWLRERMPGEEVLTVQKASGILLRGSEGVTRVDFPFQKNIHQLPRADFLECLHDLYFADPTAPATSFLEMLLGRFGKGICERFLVPYNEKLYACSMDALDPDAMGRFFPHADVAAIIRNFTQPDNQSYNATFTYPRGGAIRYIEALLRGLPPERIALGEALVSVDLERHVATTTRRQIHYDRLISSAPFDALLRCTGLPHDPAVYSANAVLVFNLGFDRKGQAHDHWLYVPDRDLSFYRVGFYDNIFGEDRMSLYVELGQARGAAPKADLARVLADLRALGIVSDHQLVSSHSVLLDPAYVHVTTASRADFAEKRGILERHGVFSAGRYGGWTYCSIEDNFLEAHRLAAQHG